MASLKGRVYAITGTASGIGQATAVRLTEMGAAGLVLGDLNTAGLEATTEVCTKAGNLKIVLTELDVIYHGQVEAWVQATVKEFTRLDGAANAAGKAGSNGETTRATTVHPSVDTSCSYGVVQLSHLVGLELLTRKTEAVRLGLCGIIVNVSSASGRCGPPNNAAYTLRKFGVIGQSESTVGEFGRESIRVSALLPWVERVSSL